MVDDVNAVGKPIEVTTAQGVTDALQAAIRYLVVIFGFLSGLAGLLGKQDATGAVLYVQENLGGTVAAVFGLVALGTATYGVYKTWKRGAQLSTTAAQPSSLVSDRIIRLKDSN